jgi:steroid 5-alpha reductase family enzyme
MSEREFYRILLFVFAGSGALVLFVLFFVSAPYGRHSRSGWGPKIVNRWGWLFMETPASLLFFGFFLLGQRKNLVPVLLLIVWQSHYLHRAFVYPFTLQRSKNMALSVVCLAIFFNLINAYLQGRWIYTFAQDDAYTNQWLTDTRFIVGILLFCTGYFINKWADTILRNLRKTGNSAYQMPQAGLFRFVSCPNYLGEMIEWGGWALAVWSLPGLVFAFWTTANLLPRARSHHVWYKKTFPDYPLHRKALLPFIY